MADPKGFTIWLTGLPCSGKSTISHALARELLARGVLIEVFDGDIVRKNLSKGLGFSREDRDTNVRRIGFVANLLTRNGVGNIVAVVSPYRSVREELRQRIGDFVEVHVSCPLETCEERDVKGMYAQARAGKRENFTGVDDPYEPPENPDVLVYTREEKLEDSVGKILQVLQERGYIGADPQQSVDSSSVKKRMAELGLG